MKNILIFGGSGKIGFDIAKYLYESGNNVIIADIKNNKYNKNFKNNNNFIKFIKCNILIDKDIDLLIVKILKLYNKIDSVIFCAYPRSSQWGSSFLSIKRKSLNKDIDGQLTSTIIAAQKIIKLFIKQKYGNMVFFSSIQGISPPKFWHYKNTNMSSPIEYSTIKAGVIMMTKYLAKLYLNCGIKVNCISPGGIYDGQDKNFLKAYKKSCGNKGMLDPKDLFGAVEFLISDKSRYITGQNIVIDDGWTL